MLLSRQQKSTPSMARGSLHSTSVAFELNIIAFLGGVQPCIRAILLPGVLAFEVTRHGLQKPNTRYAEAYDILQRENRSRRCFGRIQKDEDCRLSPTRSAFAEAKCSVRYMNSVDIKCPLHDQCKGFAMFNDV